MALLWPGGSVAVSLSSSHHDSRIAATGMMTRQGGGGMLMETALTLAAVDVTITTALAADHLEPFGGVLI